jgi:hypothetical protein
MTERGASDRSEKLRGRSGDRLKDEVYRHMFRLEANRPGADLDLAIALLRGWLASYDGTQVPKLREWLMEVCPISLLMIEAGRQWSETLQPRNR